MNTLCNLSRNEKSREGRSALPGRFLSRHFFTTLCITMEVEPRIAKQYKCQYCCSCKNYRGKVMEGGGGGGGGGKSVFASFQVLAEQKIASS